MRTLKNKGGFSLAEVLIAFTILTIGILAIVGIFPFMLRLSLAGWNLHKGSTLAQEKLNQVIAEKAALSETLYTVDYPSDLPGSGGYRRFIGVPTDNSMLQLIFVEVRWIEKGSVREVQLAGSHYIE
ncbi:MAG: prepilin-type N-terminal cleavage/methylation domain-containing protein [Candidatus Eremiobacteraeota bacterium]|nr:prepilin-type N-terminal cleavage/methylation domain-containing protein [Candidatus Eremiobacteraeota bacterium]